MATLKQSELKTLLKATINGNRRVLVVGKPGVGKTHIEAQAASEVGADNYIMYPSISDPTDFKGMPWVSDGQAEFIPFGEMRRVLDAIDEGKKVALFADDIGQAAPATQAALMSFIDRLMGKCAIIAATNRRSDKAGVHGVLEPIKSRFHSIVELEPTLDDFCNHVIDKGEGSYGLDEDTILDIVAFLRFKPDALCDFNPTLDLTNGPCPRTWIAAGQQCMLRLPVAIEFAAVAGAIGEGYAGEFSAFRRMRTNLPNLDGILLDPHNGPIPDAVSVRHAVVAGLAAKATKGNIDRIHQYGLRLMDASLGQFAALMIRDMVRRQPSLMETAEFSKIASGRIGDLISGNFE